MKKSGNNKFYNDGKNYSHDAQHKGKAYAENPENDAEFLFDRLKLAVHTFKPRAHRLFYGFKPLVNAFKAPVNSFKAPVNALKLLIYSFKPRFHCLLCRFKSLIHSVKTRVHFALLCVKPHIHFAMHGFKSFINAAKAFAHFCCQNSCFRILKGFFLFGNHNTIHTIVIQNFHYFFHFFEKNVKKSCFSAKTRGFTLKFFQGNL